MLAGDVSNLMGGLLGGQTGLAMICATFWISHPGVGDGSGATSWDENIVDN